MILFWKWATSVLLVAGFLAACALALRWVAIYVALAMLLYYSWLLYIFLHYRHIRREELLQLLTAGVEAGVPLSSTLKAYVWDRPRDRLREVFLFIVQNAILPCYYFLWHRGGRFDRKVETVAAHLQAGHTLHDALRSAPGVATRETLLAVAVGESTGRLAEALKTAPQWRLAPVWLAAMPRLIYPLVVMLVIAGVLAYQVTFILPRVERVFGDFKVRMPVPTEAVILAGRYLVRYGAIAVALLFILSGAIVAMFFSTTFCWHVPFFRHLYRPSVQGRLLRMLGLLLDAGKPVPEALALLAQSGYFRGSARRRLDQAREQLAEGRSLTDSLIAAGLLPPALAPLLNTAQRANTLPWALGEMGEALGKRVVRRAQRVVFTTFAVTLLVAGVLVGFITYGMFSPLVALLTEVGK